MPKHLKNVYVCKLYNFGAVGAFFSSIKPGKKENLTFSWLWDMLRSISDFFPEVRFELLLFWPQFETRRRLTLSIICKSLFVNLNSWPNWWNWLILTTWYSQWLLILAGAHSIQPTIANSQNALPSLWSMTTTEMLPECRGPFEFLDLISTGGRQFCKCGNDTIFKPI